jgi:hypothetical protein
MLAQEELNDRTHTGTATMRVYQDGLQVSLVMYLTSQADDPCRAVMERKIRRFVCGLQRTYHLGARNA